MWFRHFDKEHIQTALRNFAQEQRRDDFLPAMAELMFAKGERADHSDLAMPAGLCKRGQAAYSIILEFLQSKQLTYTGGNTVFYSPVEWLVRGEGCCLRSHLIVVYDGAAAAEAFDGVFQDQMQKELERAGLFAERQTCWYSAIYHL
jgi:hypothetical protein